MAPNMSPGALWVLVCRHKACSDRLASTLHLFLKISSFSFILIVSVALFWQPDEADSPDGEPNNVFIPRGPDKGQLMPKMHIEFHHPAEMLGRND